jgi:hypothetical protein
MPQAKKKGFSSLLSGTKIDSGLGNKIQHKFASLKEKRCRPYLPSY